MFREAVAAVNARLKGGDKPQDVPCPKCGNDRYVALEVIGTVPTTHAACNCCGFAWVVK
jgi:hypothetical protein